MDLNAEYAKPMRWRDLGRTMLLDATIRRVFVAAGLIALFSLILALELQAQDLPTGPYVRCVASDCQWPKWITDDGAKFYLTKPISPPVADDSSFGTIDIVEEWVGGSTATTTAGTIGISTTAIATGTGGGATGITALYGAMRFNSHATNDNSGFIAAIGSQNVFGSVGSQTVWTTTDWSIDVVFQPGSNSTAITNIGMFIGLAAAFNSDPQAGAGSVGVRFDSDRSDTTFTFVTCDSATNGCGSNGDDTNQKVVASTITPVAGTNYRFRIRRAANGVNGKPTIYMRVNDESEKTFCSLGCNAVATEVPAGTVGLAPIVMYLTRTTTGVLSGDFDYWHLRIPNIPARY